MNTVSDQPSQGTLSKLSQKRLFCPEHGNKFAFKCGYMHCQNPHLCESFTCLESHFHHQNEGKLVIMKFDTTEYSKKLGQLERVLTKEDFASEAKQLKAFVDDLKLTMVSIYKDYKQLHARKEQYALDMNKAFDFNSIDKVDETISIGNNLRKSIDTLKSKININVPGISVPALQKDEIGQKSLHPSQSPQICSSKDDKQIVIEISDKQTGEKALLPSISKENEQGQMVNDNGNKDSSQFNPLQFVPIDLELSVDQDLVSNNRAQPSSQSKAKDNEQKGKSSWSKDYFQQLFDDTSLKNKPKQISNPTCQPITAEKLANFKTFLQSMSTTGSNSKVLNNGIGSSSISSNKSSVFPQNKK